jgi:hypothetical protein
MELDELSNWWKRGFFQVVLLDDSVTVLSRIVVFQDSVVR